MKIQTAAELHRLPLKFSHRMMRAVAADKNKNMKGKIV
jgi:hypothetical protein